MRGSRGGAWLCHGERVGPPSSPGAGESRALTGRGGGGAGGTTATCAVLAGPARAPATAQAGHRPWPRRRGRAPLPPASPGQGRRRRHLRSRGRPRGAPHPVQPRVATSSFETYLTRGGKRLSWFPTPSLDWVLGTRFSSPRVPSTAGPRSGSRFRPCPRGTAGLPGTAPTCPRLLGPEEALHGARPSLAAWSQSGHRAGCLAEGGWRPAQASLLLRPASPPFGEAARLPHATARGPWLASAGRQRQAWAAVPSTGRPPSRAPGSAQAVGGEGLQAGPGAGRGSPAVPLPQRRPAGLTGRVSGAHRPPRPSQRAQSQALCEKGPELQPPRPHPGSRTLAFLIPPSADHRASVQLGRSSLCREDGPGCRHSFWGLGLPLGLGHRGKGSF